MVAEKGLLSVNNTATCVVHNVGNSMKGERLPEDWTKTCG